MTDQPPVSGWTDGYGETHDGAPPEGYWIASDGRWYPPELAADAPPSEPVPSEPVLSEPVPSEPVPSDDLASFAAPEPTPAPQIGDDPGASFDAPGGFPPPATSGFGAPPSAAPPSAAPPSAGPPSAAPPMGAPPMAAPPGTGFTPPEPAASGGDDSKKLLLIGGAVLVALLVLGGIVVAVVGGGDDDEAQTVEAIDGETDTETDSETDSETDADATTETTAADAGSDGSDNDGSETTETTAAESSGDGSSPVVAGDARVGVEGISCAPLPDDQLQLSATNSSASVVDYWLTVAFFDEAGNRIADEAAWLDSVRPGESIVEDQFAFEEGWSSCEVIDADISDVTIDQALVADVSACTVEGADFAGDVSGSVSVTNSGSDAADYVVDVALLDPTGLRRGTGTIYIDQVRAGETAPGDLFTWVDHEPGFTCEVV